jgi:hypothetical protein
MTTHPGRSHAKANAVGVRFFTYPLRSQPGGDFAESSRGYAASRRCRQRPHGGGPFFFAFKADFQHAIATCHAMSRGENCASWGKSSHPGQEAARVRLEPRSTLDTPRMHVVSLSHFETIIRRCRAPAARGERLNARRRWDPDHDSYLLRYRRPARTWRAWRSDGTGVSSSSSARQSPRRPIPPSMKTEIDFKHVNFQARQ